MLVDLPADWDQHRDPVATILTGPDYKPEHVTQGVYLTHFNFNYDIQHLLKNEHPFSPMFDHNLPYEERMKAVRDFDWENAPQDYGVCDSWKQIVEKWPSLVTDERKFIISLSEIRREDQPPQGGWRWHKWGGYIGIQNPQYEYLYDDTHIDKVYCFSIMEVL